MTRERLLLDPLDPESPARYDWIAHVDAEGKPNGLWSRVHTLEAHDPHEELYEVYDDQGTNRIITRLKGDTWLQVLIPR